MSNVALAAEVRDALADRRNRVLGAARLAGLAALLWASANSALLRLAGGHALVPLLMAAAAVSWMGWMFSRHFLDDDRVTLGFLIALATSGGILAAYAPVATGLVAVAGLGAGVALAGPQAPAVSVIGACILMLTVAAVGPPDPGVIIAEGGLSAAAGLLLGRNRRQYIERAAQAEELLAARARADAERDRAAAIAERNRLGREIHDVLAHSLGALAVQLEAADAVLDSDGDVEGARQLVRQARTLAVSGLEETRRAVHALRDEPVALTEQLTALARHEGAQITVTGSPRPLGADTGLALYRAAQEALTNARKHAPGAVVAVHLTFDRTSTLLVVTNGESANPVPSRLSETGGGFGLRGMRERVEQVGGRMVAEPKGGGFTVQVAVPQ